MAVLFKWLHSWLQHPIKVTIMVFLLAFTSLVVDGTFVHLFSLYREKNRLESKYFETVNYNQGLARKLDQARFSDTFIAQQARDKLDLLKEDELVFIFENDATTR